MVDRELKTEMGLMSVLDEIDEPKPSPPANYIYIDYIQSTIAVLIFFSVFYYFGSRGNTSSDPDPGSVELFFYIMAMITLHLLFASYAFYHKAKEKVVDAFLLLLLCGFSAFIMIWISAFTITAIDIWMLGR